MTSHESKIRVSMSFYIDIGTESHPDDIQKDVMDDIVADNAIDYLRQLTAEDLVETLMDGYEFEEVEMIEE